MVGPRYSIILAPYKMFLCCSTLHSLKSCFVQVREQGQQKGEASPYLQELLRLEEQAVQQGVGRFSKVSSLSCLSSAHCLLSISLLD